MAGFKTLDIKSVGYEFHFGNVLFFKKPFCSLESFFGSVEFAFSKADII